MSLVSILTTSVLTKLVQGEKIFQTIPERTWFSQGGRGKGQKKKWIKNTKLTRKFQWISCSSSHPHLLPSYPTILKAFLITFPTEMKPSKCPAKEKYRAKKGEKRAMEGKRKVKAKSAVSLLSPKTLISAHDRSSEADILIWNRRPRSARPVLMAFWWDLALYSQAVARNRLDSVWLLNTFFGKIPRWDGLIQKYLKVSFLSAKKHCHLGY